MRPLKLCLKNFACFKGGPVELDFAGLELFAITGPTGAGKSSLLDAMIFALYGSVPRIGRRGLAEMISLGEDRMAVTFDFRAGAKTYRITRTTRRRGPGNAEIEQLPSDGDGEVPVPLADGAREVNDVIARVLGLSYEAFTQAVVLPQGDFQRFLKSEPRERREILGKLLRLEIYRRMQQLAAIKRDQIEQTIQERERRLNEDYAGATSEALAQLQFEADGLDREIANLGTEVADSEARRDELRTRRGQTRELEQRRTRFAQLQSDEQRIHQMEVRLEASRRAAPVLPLIKAAADAEQQAVQAKREHQDLLTEHARVQLARREARESLERASRAAEEIPALQRQVEALDQVIGLIRPRPRLLRELAEAEERRADYEARLAAGLKGHEAAERDAAAKEQARRQAQEAVSALSFDPAVFEILDGSREEANGLAERRRTVQARITEVRDAQRQLQQNETALQRSETQSERAAQQAESAARKVREAEEKLAEARRREAAAFLRQGLRRGEACPVCDQPIAKLPPALRTPALDALQSRLQAARAAETASRQMAEEARGEVAGARVALSTSRRTAERATRQLTQAEAEFAQAHSSLEQRVGDLVTPEPGSNLEDAVAKAFRRVAALKRRYDAAATACERAARAAERSRHDADRAKDSIGQLETLLANANSATEAIRRHLAEIDAEVRKVTTAPDPAAQREELVERRQKLETALNAARDADARTAQELSAAGARLDASTRAQESAAGRARTAREQARSAALAAAFPSEDDAARAGLEPSEERRISAEVQEYRGERATVAARINELEQAILGREVTEAELQAAEEQVADLRRRQTTAQNSRAALGERLAEIARKIERANELRQELEAQRSGHSIYRRLALDLQSDRFQAYLLKEAFQDLASGASERLWNLTRRYRFAWENETFYVIDHDNARQQRSADTLSGGETFLASLALALQLSEQVQKAAGAVLLDSLFIDEGFGTLDPEALDCAASAIETLPVRGRMVGIITHIEELGARLPARLRVTKRPEGSQVQIEIG